jgi:poly-gamma-glutamate capsule biosynthesis protein CapA/YwtB (metallophosphatase superfamily)
MTPLKYKLILGAMLIALAGATALAMNKFINPEKINTTLPPIYEMEEQKPVETKLFFAGDIMLSRNVGTKIFEANNPNLPYINVRNWIRNADLAFANLESPFNDEGARVTQGLVFKAEPGTVMGLKEAGFDVLSTANNHTMDQGKDGLNYTMTWLSANGMESVGTGADCHDGLVREINGIKFGFLAYSYTAYNDGGKIPDPIVCNWNETKKIAEDIRALKLKADFVIVSSHMGTEYKRAPDQANAIAARAATDAGADLVIGHHPHWVQTIEEYRGKYIFYSLGNFVFDQMWSEDTKEGLAVEVLFKDKNLSRITLLPVVIDNFCCPSPADETKTKEILAKINPQAASNVLVSDGKTTADWQAALGNMGAVLNSKQLDNTAPAE